MIKVLLIEDDDRVREALEIVLRTHDCEVRAAENGMSGLTLFDTWNPDVVVTDIIMPEVEGIEAIMTIRRRAPEAAIVAISGGPRIASIDYLPMAKALGADVVLRKPVKGDELFAAIDAALASHAPQG
jgi:DNA-binding response OmpR family regulator